MDLSKLTLGDKLVAGGGILFLLFGLFMDWHHVCIDTGFAGTHCGGVGLFSGDGDAIPVLGFLAWILALAVVIATLVRKLTDTALPDLPVKWNEAIFYGAVGTVGLLVLKLIFKFDYIGVGAYLMIICAAVMAYGGFLVRSDPETESSTGGDSGGSAPF